MNITEPGLDLMALVDSTGHVLQWNYKAMTCNG